MILPFSTQLNGKPTYFVEKIWQGLLKEHFNLLGYNRFRTLACIEKVIDKWDYKIDLKPKIHTIREDKKNRWKVGTNIDFFINCRQKNMFRFAPVLPVVSIQEVSIMHETVFTNKTATIKIDGEWFAAYNFSKGNIYGKLETFIKNDGFDTIEDFFAYFNEDFKGKIIHWTDFKY